MSQPLDGIRILEVATWTFVPSSGGILADLGADVIKVEPPTGDPQRGLMNALNRVTVGPNPFVESTNRGKRSVVLDLRTAQGHDLLLRLAETADVFLTSYLPELRARLRIDVDDIRAVNPDIVYARGSGWGAAGPMRDVGGYDSAAAWSTAGIGNRLTPPGGEPAIQPGAFFDLLGGNTLAGAIGLALLQRERGQGSPVVDVSLMGVGMWSVAPDIVAAPYTEFVRPDRHNPGSPLVNWYPTADGRWINLVLLQGDRFWAELCQVIDRPDLLADERFASQASRYEHRRELVGQLDATFGSRPLAEWREKLATFSGVWAPLQTFAELHDHPQIDPNGMMTTIENEAGRFRVVAPPMRFDESTVTPKWAAPEVGQHTEEVLLELGMSWDDVAAAGKAGAFGA